MCKFEIKKTNNGRIAVYTPYDKGFVAAVKMIGGARFDWDEKCWTIPGDCIDDVRAIMLDVYGRDDREPGETVTVTVKIIDHIYTEREGISFCGKTLAKAWGRDSGARVGEDVSLVSGTICSGGSRNNWTTNIYENTVFKVRNVPKSILEHEVKDGIWKFDSGRHSGCGQATVTIDSEKIDRDALQAEKEKLLARIAEIDKLLEND